MNGADALLHASSTQEGVIDQLGVHPIHEGIVGPNMLTEFDELTQAIFISRAKLLLDK